MISHVILVDGIFHEDHMVPATGISAVGAYLRRHGFNIELFAPNNHQMGEEQTAEYLVEKRPEVIGVSILSRFQYQSFRRLVLALRTLGWHGFLCTGGHWASLGHTQILNEVEDVNCCVIGDGEETMYELLNLLSNEREWKNIPGIAYRDGNGAIHFNGARPLQDLDQYPHAAKDIVKDIVEMYGANVSIGIVSSRGCYAHCSYCSIKLHSKLQGARPYRMRAVKDVVDEMQEIQQEFAVRSFTLLDDNFLLPGPAGIKRAQEFSRLLRERGMKIELAISTRPECITYEAMSVLKDIGLNNVFIGTESFDAATLRIYNRNNTPEQSIHALDVLESLGFSSEPDSPYRVKTGSMIFHPYVTLDALYEQAQYIRKYKMPPKRLVKGLIPVPDTPLYVQLQREGLLKDDGTYRFVHPEVGLVYSALCELFDEFMSIREDIRTVEKKRRLYSLPIEIEHLHAVRLRIEEAFIKLFEELCLHGKGGGHLIADICSKQRAFLADHVITPETLESLRRALEETSRYRLSMNT